VAIATLRNLLLNASNQSRQGVVRKANHVDWFTDLPAATNDSDFGQQAALSRHGLLRIEYAKCTANLPGCTIFFCDFLGAARSSSDAPVSIRAALHQPLDAPMSGWFLGRLVGRTSSRNLRDYFGISQQLNAKSLAPSQMVWRAGWL